MRPAAQEQGLDIEQLCIAARKKVEEHINRSAGQHLRAMRKAFATARAHQIGLERWPV